MERILFARVRYSPEFPRCLCHLAKGYPATCLRGRAVKLRARHNAEN